MRLWSFGFHKMLGNYQVATQFVASWVVLSSIELGSGFPSNATLVWIFYSVTATCFGLMTIFRRKYIELVSYVCTFLSATFILRMWWCILDHLYGLVVRVPGYRSRGPGFDSPSYQSFWEVMGLELGPLSLMSTLRSYMENCSGSNVLITQLPLSGCWQAAVTQSYSSLAG
jgi:hypothetical protein